MSVYRVTIPVEFLVEINEDNVQVDGPPALQGDSALVAVRRAQWVLFRSDIRFHNRDLFRDMVKHIRSVGVRQTLVRGHEKDIKVVQVPEQEHSS